MFFLIWGSRTVLLWLGFPETHDCATCKQPRQFQLALQYRLAHMYYIFGTVSQEQYLGLCTTCQHGWKVEYSQAKVLVQKDPVPFMNRWGWLVGLGLLAVVVFTSFIGQVTQ